MSAPDQDAILAELPIQLAGKRLGAGLAARFPVADHRFFGEIAKWDALKPVLRGEVGDARATIDALIGLGDGCPNGGLLLAFGAHAFAVASCIGKFAAPDLATSLLPRLETGTLDRRAGGDRGRGRVRRHGDEDELCRERYGLSPARREDLHLERRAGRHLSRVRHQGCAAALARHLLLSGGALRAGRDALRT